MAGRTLMAARRLAVLPFAVVAVGVTACETAFTRSERPSPRIAEAEAVNAALVGCTRSQGALVELDDIGIGAGAMFNRRRHEAAFEKCLRTAAPGYEPVELTFDER
jgi:hypothetical protein